MKLKPLIVAFFPQFIPMPVLYGVFLYMGVSSLRGIQVRLLQGISSPEGLGVGKMSLRAGNSNGFCQGLMGAGSGSFQHWEGPVQHWEGQFSARRTQFSTGRGSSVLREPSSALGGPVQLSLFQALGHVGVWWWELAEFSVKGRNPCWGIPWAKRCWPEKTLE